MKKTKQKTPITVRYKYILDVDDGEGFEYSLSTHSSLNAAIVAARKQMKKYDFDSSLWVKEHRSVYEWEYRCGTRLLRITRVEAV